MYIFIKNMVCVRCKMAVQTVLDNLHISYKSIEIGRVTLTEPLTADQHKELDAGLKHYELEILDNKKMVLVERIKVLIIEMIRSDNIEASLKFTVYISKALDYDYTYLSNIFTDEEGSTIERFYIVSRIERIKELIVYEDMSIKEIAYQLNYSSVAHLCQQFKKVTGKTPSAFKKLCQSSTYVWKKCE